MKICILPENINVSQIPDDKSLSCIYLFSQSEPVKSIFFDSLTVALISIFIIVNVICSILFVRLKRVKLIISSVKYSYLFLSLFASIFHVISIFMTYGFFWPYINNAVTSHTCSLWNFWLQWFGGFAIWISILFSRIFTIAQTSIPSIITENPNYRIIQRVLLVFLLLGIVLTIGILGEAFSSFYTRESGQCTSSMFIKVSILIWLVSTISILLILSYIIKKKSKVNDDAHLINIELKIIRFAWPILLIDISLNFSGLTIYPLIRTIFIFLIILMYLWSMIVMYANELIAYYFGHNAVIGAFLIYFEITSDAKYQTVPNSWDTDGNTAVRESDDFSEEDHFSSMLLPLSVSNSNVQTAADILLSDNFDNAASTSFDMSSSDFDIQNQTKMKSLISKNNQWFDFFCNFIFSQCNILKNLSGEEKSIIFSYFDESKMQMVDIEVSLINFIPFMRDFEKIVDSFKFSNQIDENQFIEQFRDICAQYIDINIGNSNNISRQDLSNRNETKLLSKMSNYDKLQNIILPIKNDFYLTQDGLKTQLISDIKKIFNEFKEKMINDLYLFYSLSDGIREMIRDSREKEKTSKLMDSEFSSPF